MLFVIIFLALTLVSVCMESSGQVNTTILAFSTFVVSPSTCRLKTIPWMTVLWSKPEPRILQTRTLSTLKDSLAGRIDTGNARQFWHQTSNYCRDISKYTHIKKKHTLIWIKQYKTVYNFSVVHLSHAQLPCVDFFAAHAKAAFSRPLKPFHLPHLHSSSSIWKRHTAKNVHTVLCCWLKSAFLVRTVMFGFFNAGRQLCFRFFL